MTVSFTVQKNSYIYYKVHFYTFKQPEDNRFYKWLSFLVYPISLESYKAILLKTIVQLSILLQIDFTHISNTKIFIRQHAIRIYYLNKEPHREWIYQFHFLLTLFPLYTNKEYHREKGGLINLTSPQRAC